MRGDGLPAAGLAAGEHVASYLAKYSTKSTEAVGTARQQVQRAGGILRAGPVKTRAGSRDLPIVPLARQALVARQQKQAVDRAAFGRAWQDTGVVFSTRSGLPVEPRNLVRTFRRICEDHKIRVITVHHLRHTTASLLKKLRVLPRDAQMILGHAQFTTTMQIYTHVDEEPRIEALVGINDLLTPED